MNKIEVGRQAGIRYAGEIFHGLRDGWNTSGKLNKVSSGIIFKKPEERIEIIKKLIAEEAKNNSLTQTMIPEPTLEGAARFTASAVRSAIYPLFSK
jgi:hypothetical protein